MLWDPPFIGSCKGQGQVRSGYKCRGRVRGRQSVMDAKLSFRLSNCSSVTAFTYHPLRREIVTGHEGKILHRASEALNDLHKTGIIE